MVTKFPAGFDSHNGDKNVGETHTGNQSKMANPEKEGLNMGSGFGNANSTDERLWKLETDSAEEKPEVSKTRDAVLRNNNNAPKVVNLDVISANKNYSHK